MHNSLRTTKKTTGSPPRVLTALLCAACAIVFTVTGTFAWFTSFDSVHNRFRAALFGYAVRLVDLFETPENPPGPGDNVDKTVGVSNTGDLPVFTRVLVFPVITASDGATLLEANIGDQVQVALNSANWKDGNDGYFYYLGTLYPGNTTENLFSSVTLSPGLDSRYRNANLRIEVRAEYTDTKAWHYREAWWNTTSRPTSPAYAAIDDILSPLAS